VWRKRAFQFLALFGLFGLAISGQVAKPVHPDETAEYTYEKRFSCEQALAFLDNVRGALSSFVHLTGEAKKKLPASKVKAVGNTEWDVQTLGFTNWTHAIEGALRRQELELARLRSQLAEERAKSGGATPEEVRDAQRAYQAARQSFQEFWNRFSIAD
jgi:hypothetical protein